MLSCKKCGIQFENSKFLNKSKIVDNPDKYLHTCKECRTIKICKHCGIEYKHKQNQTCSIECAKELKKKTYMKSQGAPHNFCKNSKSKLNFEKELQDNYGVTNVFQRDDVKCSIEKTMLSRYGVKNISQNESIKAKKYETFQNTIKSNPDMVKTSWWNSHHEFIKNMGYDPRLGMFGKASIESLKIFKPIVKFCMDIGISDSDIYIGHGDSSEFFINSGKKIYFYDFCIRSVKLIIEYHGIGFHANPNWDDSKLNEWRSIFTNETSRENILKTKIKNNAAYRKGFKILEIWSDSFIDNNIEACKSFILNNYEN